MRSFLYMMARVMGDINAISKGKIGRRVGRRLVGRGTGRILRSLFK